MLPFVPRRPRPTRLNRKLIKKLIKLDRKTLVTKKYQEYVWMIGTARQRHSGHSQCSGWLFPRRRGENFLQKPDLLHPHKKIIPQYKPPTVKDNPRHKKGERRTLRYKFFSRSEDLLEIS
jgi:hypothetical protein